MTGRCQLRLPTYTAGLGRRPQTVDAAIVLSRCGPVNCHLRRASPPAVGSRAVDGFRRHEHVILRIGGGRQLRVDVRLELPSKTSDGAPWAGAPRPNRETCLAHHFPPPQPSLVGHAGPWVVRNTVAVSATLCAPDGSSTARNWLVIVVPVTHRAGGS